MAEKGMFYVVRENTFTLLIERLLRSQRNRRRVATYLDNLGAQPLDPAHLVTALGVNLNQRFDIAYSLFKIFGEKVPGNSDLPYWHSIPADLRREVTREALGSIVSLDRPVMMFWLSIEARTVPGRRNEVDVGFKYQITKKGDFTVVHFITPPPALRANKAAALLNKKRKSWVIGGRQTIQKQATEMNLAHKELLRRNRIAPAQVSAKFEASEIGASGEIKYIQLRHFDPNVRNMKILDYKNDKIR